MTGEIRLVHEVPVIGWGQEGDDKFWILKNTWGTYFGEGGYIRLARGINNLGIETECTWAVPLDTWTEKKVHKVSKPEPEAP